MSVRLYKCWPRRLHPQFAFTVGLFGFKFVDIFLSKRLVMVTLLGCTFFWKTNDLHVQTWW